MPVKYSVYSVNDPTWGVIYYPTLAQAKQHEGVITEQVIDFSKFRAEPAVLFCNLLNREGYTEYSKEIKR